MLCVWKTAMLCLSNTKRVALGWLEEQGEQGGQEGGRRASLPACQPAQPASLPSLGTRLPACQPDTLPTSQSPKGAAAEGGRPL